MTFRVIVLKFTVKTYNKKDNKIHIEIQTNWMKFPVRFYSRNKSVRLLGRSDSSQQTAMPTVIRVVSILNFTTFQNGDTTFYRRISRKHRFQRLCRYILSDFQGFIRVLSIRLCTTSNLPFVRHCKPNKRGCWGSKDRTPTSSFSFPLPMCQKFDYIIQRNRADRSLLRNSIYFWFSTKDF